MTKILSAISMVLMIALLLPGCVAVNFTTAAVRGTGGIVARYYTAEQLGDFNKLNIQIPANLYFSIGEPNVTVEAYENQLPLITVNTNSDGELVIGSTASVFNTEPNGGSPKIHVSAPALEALDVYGAVHIAEADKITAEKFGFFVDGSASGTLDLDVDDLTVNISGAAALELTGKADKADITNAGVGALDAYGLETKDAEVTVDGVGSVEITCTGTLDAEVNGLGSISHRGGAQVTESIEGLGSISEG